MKTSNLLSRGKNIIIIITTYRNMLLHYIIVVHQLMQLTILLFYFLPRNIDYLNLNNKRERLDFLVQCLEVIVFLFMIRKGHSQA